MHDVVTIGMLAFCCGGIVQNIMFDVRTQVVGLCVGMLVGTVIHAIVFVILAARADWDADAAQALRRSGITLPMSAFEGPDAAGGREHSPPHVPKLQHEGIDLPPRSGGVGRSEDEEDDSSENTRLLQ
jgi:hypothetical protein